MISLEKLGYFLPQGFLFSDVSLQINRGDKIGLVGKNGAGKSTMLRLLTGQIQPSEGRIHLPKEMKIGMLSQDIKINTSKSVFEYLVTSNHVLTGLNEKIEQINEALTTRTDYESDSYLALLDELSDCNQSFQIHDGYNWEEKIMSVLEGLGFDKREVHRPLDTFSGGWKMRAELAKILVNEPDALLLDEPTNGLDPVGIAEIRDLIKGLSAAGHTVIMASHLLDEVERICDHVAILKFGQLITSGPVQSVLADEDCYLLNANDQEVLASVMQNFPGISRVLKTTDGLECYFKISF